MIDATDRLLRALDYRFKEPGLLQQALTHRSASRNHNERLEFLGDATLGLVVAEALYAAFPDATEGQLSRLRASLVNGETLAEIAGSLELGEYLALGSGELKSGGYRRASILADALEAVFGAVLLDGGMDAARRLILALYGERITRLDMVTNLKDAKTRLQEWLQARGQALPVYAVADVEGKDHDQTFSVRCSVPDAGHETRGTGSSRRKAEQDAAKKMLRALESAGG